jgi:hypothetical protein
MLAQLTSQSILLARHSPMQEKLHLPMLPLMLLAGLHTTTKHTRHKIPSLPAQCFQDALLKFVCGEIMTTGEDIKNKLQIW